MAVLLPKQETTAKSDEKYESLGVPQSGRQPSVPNRNCTYNRVVKPVSRTVPRGK